MVLRKTITKMPGFFARSYYCHTCKKAYSNYENHLCLDACKCCGFRPACPEESWIACNYCHCSFKSQQCYDHYKEWRGEARPVCQNLIKCTKCNKAVQPCYAAPEERGCGMKKCWICGKFVKIEDHKCFIQPELKKRKRDHSEEEEESNGFFDTECRDDNHEDDDEPFEETLTDLLFFDFECRQENGTHEPNLCIVQNEAGDEWIFQGDTTQEGFCDWLFTDEHIGCTTVTLFFSIYASKALCMK